MKHQHYIHPEKKDFSIHTDPDLLDLEYVHRYLKEESYWAGDSEKEETAGMLRDGLCFGVFYQKRQIGVASVTTDGRSYAYISDVFIDEKYERQGLATWLIECVLSHPMIKNLSHCMLLTDDAHSFYEKMGFKRIAGSADQMIKYK
ncbi:MAG TPA: N-acetyltransferase [Bacteroidetes bacterium]|nr:N-acetyltransferase [Bacteroidota bacterium]